MVLFVQVVKVLDKYTVTNDLKREDTIFGWMENESVLPCVLASAISFRLAPVLDPPGATG